jgi:hypothetical protein
MKEGDRSPMKRTVDGKPKESRDARRGKKAGVPSLEGTYVVRAGAPEGKGLSGAAVPLMAKGKVISVVFLEAGVKPTVESLSKQLLEYFRASVLASSRMSYR